MSKSELFVYFSWQSRFSIGNGECMNSKLDPITLELIHSKVTSVIEEMRIVLFHSGYSTVLRESEDGSAGLLDARLRTVSVSKKLPLHFGSFAAVADHLGEYYRMDDFEDGDVVVFNHPYAGNVTHPNDTVVLMPVFAREKISRVHRNAGAQGRLGRPAPGPCAAGYLGGRVGNPAEQALRARQSES